MASFWDDIGNFFEDSWPWLAGGAAALAAPFALPAIFGGLGLGGAAAGGAGLLGAEAAIGGAAGAGTIGAEAGIGAGLFGGAEAGLFGGAEALGAGLGGGLGGGTSIGAGAGVGGIDSLASLLGLESGGAFGSDALSAFAAAPEAGGSSIFGTAGGAPSGALDTLLTHETAHMAAGASPGASGVSPVAEAGFFDKLVSGAGKSLTTNPLGIGAAGIGLGMNILGGQGKSPNATALGANAAALNEQGKQLMSYLQSGTLPPGLQTAVSNATSAMKARIVANHARTGGNTNPAQNSALAQELNQVDLNATALIAQQGQQLLTTGMNAVNMSSQLYGMLESLDRQQSQRMGQAIASFASALSGPARITLNAGGVQRGP